jgi:quercetin dioxygenase-like cupin family protein
MMVRRVVTGHDETGKSIFVVDGPPPKAKKFKHTPGFVLNPVWMTAAEVAKAGSNEPDMTVSATSLHAEPGGSALLIITFPPDSVMARADFDFSVAWPEHLAEVAGIAERFEPDAPGMHQTDTLDYAIVLSGEIWLELDDGATRHLVENDVVIQQGTRHAWRNKTDSPTTLAFCMLGRRPRP